jgi:hypothetical protein
MPKKISPLQTAAIDALTVQDACNISGVVHAFARAMPAILEDCRTQGKGTDMARTHPITLAFMDKLNSMIGRDDMPNGQDRMMLAFDSVMTIAGRSYREG